MTQFYIFNPDVNIFNKNESWIISNPRMRQHVKMEAFHLSELIKKTQKNNKVATELTFEELINICEGISAQDVTSDFVGEFGLVSDHSCLNLNKESKSVFGKELAALLVSKNIFIEKKLGPLENVKLIENIFDRKHLGSFHQRVGQFILIKKRSKEPWREWQDQKYSKDGTALLDTSYKFLQENFFDEYFNQTSLKESLVIDFGCGNGFYSAKFAKYAKNVLGLDNSSELLTLANHNYSNVKNLNFEKTNTFKEVRERLEKIPENSIDLIYLQDTLLLLIQPEHAAEADSDLEDLLTAFHRVLKKDGSLCAMEPNPIFWLASRQGYENKPFAIITEYKNRVFNVAPTLDKVLNVTSAAGFGLSKLLHPYYNGKDKTKFGFEAEFPIWDFFVFKPLSK